MECVTLDMLFLKAHLVSFGVTHQCKHSLNHVHHYNYLTSHHLITCSSQHLLATLCWLHNHHSLILWWHSLSLWGLPDHSLALWLVTSFSGSVVTSFSGTVVVFSGAVVASQSLSGSFILWHCGGFPIIL